MKLYKLSVNQDQQHQYPAEQLSYNTSQFQSPTTQTPFRQQDGPTQDEFIDRQKQVHSSFHETVTFDDAPEIIYGVATRTRRVTPCERVELRCEELINEDKVVHCEQPRFRQAYNYYTTR